MFVNSITLRVVLLTAAAAAALPAQRVATRCVAGTWSAPRPVTMADGRPVYVEAPFPVRFAGGLALLGTPTFVWRSPTVFADSGRRPAMDVPEPSGIAGIVLDAHGTPRLVPMPPGISRMSSPLDVRFDADSLDVFWGNADTAAGGPTAPVRAVWHARYTMRGWGTPRRVLADARIWWNNSYPDLRAAPGLLQLAVPAVRGTGRQAESGVAVLLRDASGWHSRWIATPGELPRNSVGSIPDRRGRSVVAFLGADPTRGSPLGSADVFVSTSRDSGTTWSHPRVIAHYVGAAVNALQLVQGPAGALQLFWHVDSASNETDYAVERARSRDVGNSWTFDRPLAAGMPVGTLAATRLGARTALVARALDTGELSFALAPADHLVPFRRLSLSPSPSIPRIAAFGADSLLLVLGVLRRHAYPLFPNYPVPALLTATFVPGCSGGP